MLVCQTVPAGVELALGIVRDPELGPLVVVGAGGVLVELLADRGVALPPVSAALAGELLADLRVRTLLDGVRGAPPADLGAVIRGHPRPVGAGRSSWATSSTRWTSTR